MIRALFVLLALAAPAAQACAAAEGCPMGDPPLRSCDMVRVAEGFVCIDDPTSPAGFVIVPEGGTVPPDAPDCGVGEWCLAPQPEEPTGASLTPALGAALAVPLVGLLILLGVSARR